MQRELATKGSTLTFFVSVGIWQPNDGHGCGGHELFVRLGEYLPRNVATGSANNLKWPPLDQEVETEDSKP
jgi:hypothetical protein